MDFSKINITRHITADRADRIRDIIANGGLGVADCWLESQKDEHIVHVMTTTKVILVVDKITSTCLTLYRANAKQLYVFKHKAHKFA